MPAPALTDRQLEVLRFLVERYRSDERMGYRVVAESIPRQPGETVSEIKHMLLHFQRFGWVSWATNESVNVRDAADEYLFQLDNPPPRNYFSDWTAWWFSSRWKTAITVIAILLPWIVQWVEMLRTVLRWLGAID